MEEHGSVALLISGIVGTVMLCTGTTLLLSVPEPAMQVRQWTELLVAMICLATPILSWIVADRMLAGSIRAGRKSDR